MIYLITLFFLVIFIFKYDLTGKIHDAKYNRLYYVIMWWFICVSGFAYNVGSDIPIYMKWYDEISLNDYNSISDLIDHENHQMPGWTLLMIICKSISKNFLLPKLVISIFCNCVFFKFIKRHSQYPLITVLFYGLSLYLNMNFNALRQMIAVSIFLLSYEYLLNKKLLNYYLLVLLAYLFHSSAIVCLVFPILHLYHITKKTLFMTAFLVLLIAIIFLVSDFGNIINNILIVGSAYFTGDIAALAEMYLDDISGSDLNFFGQINIIISLLIVIIIVSVSYDSTNKDNMIYKLTLIYCLFYALNFSIGVVFSRLIYYVEFFYICILPFGIMQIAKKMFKKSLLIVILLLCFLAKRPIDNLYRVNPKYDYPLLVQYYPYYSVFNPKIDPLRNNLFGSYD